MSDQNEKLRAELWAEKDKVRGYGNRIDSVLYERDKQRERAEAAEDERDAARSEVKLLRDVTERYRLVVEDVHANGRSSALASLKARAEAAEAKLAKVREWRERAKKIEADGWNLTKDDWRLLDAIINADTKEAER